MRAQAATVAAWGAAVVAVNKLRGRAGGTAAAPLRAGEAAAAASEDAAATAADAAAATATDVSTWGGRVLRVHASALSALQEAAGALARLSGGAQPLVRAAPAPAPPLPAPWPADGPGAPAASHVTAMPPLAEPANLGWAPRSGEESGAESEEEGGTAAAIVAAVQATFMLPWDASAEPPPATAVAPAGGGAAPGGGTVRGERPTPRALSPAFARLHFVLPGRVVHVRREAAEGEGAEGSPPRAQWRVVAASRGEFEEFAVTRQMFADHAMGGVEEALAHAAAGDSTRV